MKLSQLNRMPRTIALAALTLSASTLVHAAPNVVSGSGTPDPVQSKATPYGLQPIAPVMEAGSTAASQNFDANVLPGALAFIKSALPEGHNNTASKAFQIDPSKLTMATTHDVTATFIYEGAAYHNSIGLTTVAPGQSQPQSTWDEVTAPTAGLVFPDASSTSSGYPDGGSVAGTRTQSQPVLPGDFTDLGTIKQGTALDFFLLSNGANNSWAPVFSTQEGLNPDGFKQHVAEFSPSLFAVPQLNSPYVFLSFEDLYGGGDKDINDTIIAINIGAANVKALLATPEPAMPLTFTACLGLALFAVRKNQQNHQKKVTTV